MPKDKEVLNTISQIVGKPKPPKEDFFKGLKDYRLKDGPIKIERKKKK